jgi:conjugative transposon TraM protein
MKKQKLNDPRKKKMLLVLPFLIIPFLTMGFWSLGGGKSDATNAQSQTAGLNLELPNAQLKDEKGENKLSYYEQAEKDSIKWEEKVKNDPFSQAGLNDSTSQRNFGYDPYPFEHGNYKDPNEQKVYRKLEELNSHLQNSNDYSTNDRNNGLKYSSNPRSSFSKEDLDRLENMMKNVSSPGSKDPEVEQLSGMMDRILDIQHPERVKQKLSENSEKDKDKVYAVNMKDEQYTISLLDTANNDKQQRNAFYSADDMEDRSEQNAIEAVVHETQSLVNGSIVKMRLLDDIVLGQNIIGKGSFVFGKAYLEGERLHIKINSLRKKNSLFPVKLFVYDLDGMEGIHIPGAITRNVAKQSADNSLQTIEMTSLDPSFKAQATSAGINAAKTLLSKKAQLVKVTVKDGYNILLKEKM